MRLKHTARIHLSRFCRRRFFARAPLRLLPLTLVAFGCGKAERFELDAAIMSNIYDDPAFFETVCGYPLEPPWQPRVQILEAEGEAQPWLGTKPVPGTARIRLTGVVRKGVSGEQTCEAKIGFLWTEEKGVVAERGHAVRASSDFHAQAFTKLGP